MGINFTWERTTGTKSASIEMRYYGYKDNLLSNNASSFIYKEKDGSHTFYSNTGDPTKVIYIEYKKSGSSISNAKCYIKDYEELEMTRVDMSKFTFKYKKRRSTSELGAKIAGQLLSADNQKQVLIYNFRILDEANPATNTCVLSSIYETKDDSENIIRTLSGLITYNNESYTIYLTVNSTNIQEYRIVSNGMANIPFSGLTITNSLKTSSSKGYYNNIISPLFGAAENYRTIASEKVGMPIILYGFKLLDTSDSRNNFVLLQYTQEGTTITEEPLYNNWVQFNGNFERTKGSNQGIYNIQVTARSHQGFQLYRDNSKDSGTTWKAWSDDLSKSSSNRLTVYTRVYSGQGTGYPPTVGDMVFKETNKSSSEFGLVTAYDSDVDVMTCDIGDIQYKVLNQYAVLPKFNLEGEEGDYYSLKVQVIGGNIVYKWVPDT